MIPWYPLLLKKLHSDSYWSSPGAQLTSQFANRSFEVASRSTKQLVRGGGTGEREGEAATGADVLCQSGVWILSKCGTCMCVYVCVYLCIHISTHGNSDAILPT